MKTTAAALWLLNDAAQLLFAGLAVWLLFSGTWLQVCYAVAGLRMAGAWKLKVAPQMPARIRRWLRGR